MINLWWSVFAVAAFSAGSLHDVGVENIVNPPLGHNNAIVPGETLSVVAQIRNYGVQTERQLNVGLTISDLNAQPDTVVFDTVYTVDSLRKNETKEITFPIWNIPNEPAYCYCMKVFTRLPGDVNPMNDTICLTAQPGYIYPTAIAEGNENPEQFQIGKIRPTLGSSFFEIDYTFSAETYLSISIFDLTGRKIKTLFNNKQQSGTWKIIWNGRDDAGQKVCAGIYFIRFETSAYQATKKTILCKPR